VTEGLHALHTAASSAQEALLRAAPSSRDGARSEYIWRYGLHHSPVPVLIVHADRTPKPEPIQVPPAADSAAAA
jgi:hypothetical protein